MKNKYILGFAVLGLAVSACKKDRTCSCTTVTTGLINTSIVTDSTLTGMTKAEAEELCSSQNYNISIFGNTVDISCELK